MTKKKLLISTLLLASFTAGSAYAVTINNASATATVAPALSLEQMTGLSFGTFTVSTGNGGTINTSGVTNTGGGVTAISGATPGIFKITGAANAPITQVGGDNTVTLTRNGGGDTMQAALTRPANTTIESDGDVTFQITGVLTVGANQAVGLYSGTYGVTVNY